VAVTLDEPAVVVRLDKGLGSGNQLYCSCPFGEHGFYMILEASSSEEVISALPAEWRRGTRAVPCEAFRLPD
jgi:hypothetical protein